MRLVEFQITGHRVLKDLQVQVREHLVVVGANDVGKTSVLRLLHLLLGASVQQLYQGLGVHDLRTPEEPLLVEARLEGFDPDEAGHFPFAMTVLEGEPDYLLIRLEVRAAEGDAESVVVERYFPDAGSRRGPSREQLQQVGWRYLTADRATGAEFVDGRHSPFRAMLDSIDAGEELEGLGGLLHRFNEQLADSAALTQLRTQIAAHLSRSVPRAYTEQSLAIRTTADPDQQPLQDVTVFLRDGEEMRGLSEQSDGMRQLMALTFFDLAQASANIVAVDEPEIHLHPSSQRTVASLFAESERQRLVVTHSPYVVQRFEPKHVLVIDPDSRGRQIPARSFSAVEKEQVQWWSPQLLEGLTARQILFVEGVADRIVVEAAAAAVGVNLDRAGVSLFVLDGADKFKHVLQILGSGGFGLPLCGMCDADRRDSWATHLKLPAKRLGEAGFFVASPELEHEYVEAIGGPAVAQALVSEGVTKERGLLEAVGAPSLQEVTAQQVADFIVAQNSRKVPAARIAASLLQPQHVQTCSPLFGLLTHVQAG